MTVIEVRQVPEAGRFVALVDGEPAGFTRYVERGGRRVFVHTEIDDAFAGHGVGNRLVADALEATRRAGLRIVPVCPFVAAWLERHPGFEDVVDLAVPQREDR